VNHHLSAFFFRRPKIVTFLLILLPLAYMLVVYLGSLFALLVNSFYYLEEFTGLVVKEFTLNTYAQLLKPSNLGIFSRTVGMALAVTFMDAILAFPLAYYIAKFASSRMRTYLYIAVTLPLWSSYLVRVYAWKLILSKEGILSWFIDLFHMNPALDWVLSLPGIGGSSLSLSPIGMFIAFCYIWLPYMIVPIQASLERVPKSVIEASGDLGANPSQTFRNIIFPLSLPGVIAGSIFTFSLTLGDFIIPQVLGTSRFFIGQAVYSHQGTSGNIPLAAAFTMGPVVIMIAYLLIARRLGAFDAL
jgi:putative spermidine/putrescine transport system permease protein